MEHRLPAKRLTDMDRWDGGSDYEVFMGRWSRLVAREFVTRLRADPGLRWLDVGCGTGALLATVVESENPSLASGVDPSVEFVEEARTRLDDKADIRVAGGEDLPFDDDSFDIVVSGLALNFIPDPLAAVREWKRVARSGGTVAAYVWDYANGMGFLRYFWDAAADRDPAARLLDEGHRFPICRLAPLHDLLEEAGLSAVEGGSIEIPTPFSDSADYWKPFLRGQGPAPGYVAGLTDPQRRDLESHLRSTIPRSGDGSLAMTARAWTISGRV